jgi:4-coumarate--CoA ligase
MAHNWLSPANPSFSQDELVYQLTTTKARFILVHPDSLPIALSACRTAGIPEIHIALFDNDPNSTSIQSFPTLNDLITTGLSQEPNFVERQLDPGESKTRLAFLCFSSGTTGHPKVS